MSSILDMVGRGERVATQESAMSASFEEKSVWIQLGALVVCGSIYGAIAGRLLASGVREMPAYAAIFMIAVVVMVVFMIVAYAMVALSGRQEGSDERDRLIAWRSEHNSGWVLATGVLTGVACMVLGLENVWTANILLGSLFLAEGLGLSLRLRYYHKGV